MLAFSQAGEAYDVLLLNPRASAPTNAFWTDGSLYRGNDGILYHKVSGSWVPLGSAAENLVNVASGVIIGRTTAGSGNSEELSATQARALLNVEDGATADQSGAEIKAAYEGEANTNAFTDAEKTKLTGIETGATADQSGPELEAALDTELANTRWKEVEVPAGGTTGQVLKKDTGTDYDYSWQDDGGGSGGGGGLLANELSVGSDVADADHAGVRNVMLLAGNADVEIPADATYNHPVGTILYYTTQTFEGTINITFEAGVTGTALSTGTLAGPNIYFVKTAANQWESIPAGWTQVSAHPQTDETGIRIGIFDDQASLDAATLGAADIGVCKTCTPMKVIPTATWDTDNGAVAMDGWKGVDDRTIDEPTWTFSECGFGEKLTVWINRASAPTLAGSGLTFNPLPGNPFEANTEMAVYFEVGMDGTTIDYYYYLRE